MISGCRFPLWRDGERPTFIYCGKRRRGMESSYCEKHHKLTHTKSRQGVDKVNFNFGPRKLTPLRRY